MANLEYQYKGHSIKPMVLETDDGRFQGIVLIVPGIGKHGEQDRICVPTTSSSYSEALDEAKALAHRTFADKSSADLNG